MRKLEERKDNWQMLSPYIKLNDNCGLCSRLRLANSDKDFLFDGGHNLYIFKSPFAEKWPGALMPIFKRHIYEQSDIRPSDLPDTLHTLVCLEKALRKVTNCKRINLVKFANISHHLHWHLIPRYHNEIYSNKCSWELENVPREKIYSKIEESLFEDTSLYEKIRSQALFEINNRSSPYFGCALFLRPCELELRSKIFTLDLDEIIKLARDNPEKWECLLMKRNYHDFAWDFIGGNCEVNEYPEFGMIREVKEEVGWNITRYKEVTRQWKMGAIKGIVYLAIPENQRYMDDEPERVHCAEVETVKYFNLVEIMNSPNFVDSVKGRIKAFIENKADFDSIDS